MGGLWEGLDVRGVVSDAYPMLSRMGADGKQRKKAVTLAALEP